MQHVAAGTHREACGAQHRRTLGGVVQPHAHGDGGVAEQVGNGALGEGAAAVEHRDRVGDLLCLREHTGRDQHRRALVGQAAQRLPHLAGADGVEPGRRLVDHQEVGGAQQRGRERQPTGLVRGVGAVGGLGAVGEHDAGEHLVDAGAWHTGRAGEEREVAGAAQRGLEPGFADDGADAARELGQPVGHGHAEDLDGAAVGPGQAGEQAERRRPAGSRRAEEGVQAAGRDPEVEPVDAHGAPVQRAVRLAQPERLDGGVVPRGHRRYQVIAPCSDVGAGSTPSRSRSTVRS
nr:hypothetical protein GCM10025730_43080 [Promicromonospora thailandica]